MKKMELLAKVQTTVSKFGFKVKKHSPEILMTTGLVGMVASSVLACRATTKISVILDTHKETMTAIHEHSVPPNEEYTVQDAKKDSLITYFQTSSKLALLYGPAVILGGVSIGCIIASNNILRQRNAALTAALATVTIGFKEYRQRVSERYGEEAEREIRLNIKTKTIEKKVIDAKGKEKIVKETVKVADPNLKSSYARYFDNTSAYWEENSHYNQTFLSAQQRYANDKLKADGYIFLNDVYHMLGLKKTKAGQVVGWIDESKESNGDGYVDFRIQEIYREVDGELEPSILLDFNVDCNIWTLMKEENEE